MSKKPKLGKTKPDPLEDPWSFLRKKPGVTIKSTARRDPK